MRYIFYCPHCGFTGSDLQSQAYKPPKCPECHNTLKYTGIPQPEWKEKTAEEKALWKNKWNEDLAKSSSGVGKEEALNCRINHMLTSGYNFEGYKITSYNGIVSGEAVMGTGFLSEFSASITDFFGQTSEEFSIKMMQAKEAAISRMTDVSVSKNGNAIIGVAFNYAVFGNNMIGVSANGTSVFVEKLPE